MQHFDPAKTIPTQTVCCDRDYVPGSIVGDSKQIQF